MPVVQFNAIEGVCEEATSFMIRAAGEITGLPGTGRYEGPGITPEGLFRPAMAHHGLHTISYTFTADNGCMVTRVQPVEVFASPVVYAGPDRATREGNPVKLEGSGSGDGIRFQWTPPAGMDNSRIATPVVSPPNDITYKLTVISAQGCTASDEMAVKVINKINIPNAFTPDNNRKNDSWIIPNLELFDNCTVQVYNRWGQRVFQSKGYSRPWDGSLNGQPLSPGAYTYIIDLKNGQPPMRGVVMLLR
jgi:gliding motility-associated-like protein